MHIILHKGIDTDNIWTNAMESVEDLLTGSWFSDFCKAFTFILNGVINSLCLETLQIYNGKWDLI